MRTSGRIAALTLVIGCTGSNVGKDEGPGTEPLGEPTDTIPSFYGKVPKNLLILSIDTFRRDHAGSYAPPGAMPFLAQIMAEGFTLDNHMECSNWTYMGTACATNGRHNEENGFIPELGGLRAPLPDGPTLASGLALHGFHTILATGNSWFSEEWNNAQGFAETDLVGGAAVNVYGSGLSMLEGAILRGDVRNGWLLHAHLMEPHAPYNPPPSYIPGISSLPPLQWDLTIKDEHYNASSEWPVMTAEEQANLKAHMDLRYEGELAYLDDQLRTIWADLTAHGLLEDTLVVVFNDHGEQIWDHGQESHAYSLYHEENDGIAIFWSQNIVPGAWTGPTSQIDLAPTLLGLMGAPIPEEMTGLPLGQAAPDRPTFALTSARNNTIQSVRQNGFKLIYTWRTGSVELYDLTADPLELSNVYDSADPVAQQLWGALLPQIELAQPVVLDDTPLWPPGLPQPGELPDSGTP